MVIESIGYRFHGPLAKTSKTSNPFTSLQILDLSNNNFSGLLPTIYLRNFHAMMKSDAEKRSFKYIGESDTRYNDSTSMVLKGSEIELVRILNIFTTIDISSNKIEGNIRDYIGNLDALLILNLSHNNLAGRIPSALGNLSMLESLDISNNKLEGRILQLTLQS